MTKKQREQVVELLRCAADVRWTGVGLNGLFGTSDDLGIETALHNDAWESLFNVRQVQCEFGCDRSVVDEAYRRRLLEAAQRVEEGWTP